jgi:hypothetical protein
MCIKAGSHVEIVGGRFTGCVGICRNFWLYPDGDLFLYVELYSALDRGFVTGLFRPCEIKRRKLTPIQREDVEMAQAIEEAARRAAA